MTRSRGTTDPMVEVTILMPCLNEALTLASCIRKARAFLSQTGTDGEVLIADNGSTDGSQALASAEGARVIQVGQRGYGAALWAGIESARGRYVIMGDSDDSYDFSQLQGFVDALRHGHQLVMGNRFAGGIKPGAMPALHRYLGNPVLSFVGRLFFRSPVRDFHCGLRGFDRQAMLALELQSTGMEFASEMVVKATLGGLRIAEVPTTLSPDGRDRPPHLRSWRDGWRHLRFLLVHAPAWLFMAPGLALLLLGIGLAVPLARGPLPLGRFTLDIHTLLYAVVMACVGLQMLLFAGASSSHAVQIGVLPRMPKGLAWARTVSLEAALLTGLAIFLLGAVLAGVTLWMWSGADFRAIDPGRLMRVAIPAAGLMMAGILVATSAFMMEYLRLAPRTAAGEAPLPS
ncbi:MAG: glycosyltransferase family 2 protein [Proteobacteria bacterium]|nr:glycosyltransferase family 2 protein [Pseudomonadota bacterium]